MWTDLSFFHWLSDEGCQRLWDSSMLLQPRMQWRCHVSGAKGNCLNEKIYGKATSSDLYIYRNEINYDLKKKTKIHHLWFAIKDVLIIKVPGTLGSAIETLKVTTIIKHKSFQRLYQASSPSTHQNGTFRHSHESDDGRLVNQTHCIHVHQITN